MKTDRELVQWALEHGWKYFSMNRQLMNPQGGMVTVQGWDNLPDDVRSEIERQFAAHAPSKEGQ